MVDQDRIDLKIERHGPKFVLVRTARGQTTRLDLTESDILALGRIFPSYARALKAERSRPGISAWTAIPAEDYWINEDLHHQLVMLRIRDADQAEFEFSFEPSGAHKLGESLIKWAERVESAPKETRQ
jgi:hypothetical protein